MIERHGESAPFRLVMLGGGAAKKVPFAPPLLHRKRLANSVDVSGLRVYSL